ncbi:Na+/Pi-cotransporter [Ruegeria lacuscaerulensis ITI-1157]|nr:Na+/Pi-cotransporter [Ruegeria lacuscaerulensis ITI-1157]SHI99170.1 phosphate:Na+ symporter [Ruegeria lacuscaerulensis ITI-1157]
MIVMATHLAAAVALLLWSVRLIRTGVERAFLPELKRGLKVLSDRSLTAALGGGLTAMLMQSATAVALIGAGFAVSGMLAPQSALAVILGAEVGSALMAQVLFLPVQAVIPFALLAGVVTFLKARRRKAKQIGRIVIGFALVLMSLGMIRDATVSIGSNPIVQSIATYFQNDLLSAYVIGAVLAWVMHSSLAAVLTFATFAASGLVASPVAAALVIGANLGGAAIPVALLWGQERPARLVVLSNLAARACVTLIALALLLAGVVQMGVLGPVPGQQVVALHILLNIALLVLALPLTGPLVRLVDAVLPRHSPTEPESVSALDSSALDHPPLALACAQRELLRMAETVQAMLVPVIHLFRNWDPDLARTIQLREDEVDRMHFAIKIYISRMGENDLTPEQEKKSLGIVAMANNLEEAADRIAVNLVGLARKLADEAVTFSKEGLDDIEQFHDQVVTNGQLALSVLTTGDAEAARQLVAEKDRIRIEEQKLQERHLKRLQNGASASIETTNIHQETLRLLKQVNAALAFVAYPIAEETGDLLRSRLAHPRKIGGAS